MEQELFRIGIIGGGPAGCACAYFIKKIVPFANVSIIDKNPMKTILPTGGGRCNLAHAEYDFMDLAKNYPRGEKFLYSVFSQFSTTDTLDFFNEIGIKTFCQDDGRIFPLSESSKEVYDKILESLSGVNFIRETALRLEQVENKFKVITDMNSYNFNKVVYSVGGHCGYDIVKRLGISVIPPKPSLAGFVTSKKFTDIMGVSVKNVYNYETKNIGDVLFTHFGLSGPLIYKISSLYARKEFPYKLTFNLLPEVDDFQLVLDKNPHKYLKNILSEYVPHALSEFVLDELRINKNLKGHSVNAKNRDVVLNKLMNYEITVTSTKKDGETVTSGGVDLNRINPKTMESKDIKNLYFCGEVIDVDGFCGGFNLQNCWSTAFVCAKAIVC